jgi:beta-lactamase class A
MWHRALLTLVLGIGGFALAPTAPAAAASCSTVFPATFVAELERAYPGVRFTAAVYDTASGCWHHVHPGMQITTASVIKAQVLGAVLLRAQDAGRSLTSTERSLITPMIRYSSNPETSQLVELVGGAAGMHATDPRLGATATTHVRPFGLTRSTAVDRTRVSLALLRGGGALAQSGREEAWAAMTAVHPLQQWGITAGVPLGWSVALKNGFYPATDIGWRVGSTGFVRRDDGDQGYAITVMTEGMRLQTTGIGIVERIARQAAAGLTVGPPAGRAVDRARCVTATFGESWTSVTSRLGLSAGQLAAVRLTSGGNTTPLGGQRACAPDIPAERANAGSAVNGRYRPVVTDLDCDGRDDVVWYGPGSAGDYLWHGGLDRRFRSTPLTIAGDLVPVAGDFDGDGCGDIVWYGAGSRGDAVWWGGRTITPAPLSIRGLGYVPRSGDFDGDGRTDLLWYAPGAQADYLWYGSAARTFSSQPAVATLSYVPVLGDVDGNGADDVVWYAPGVAADKVWFGQVGTRAFTSGAFTANQRYRPVVLDHDGAAVRGSGDALLWYGPTTTTDFLWHELPPVTSRPLSVTGDYLPVVGEFDGDGFEDVVWYGPGTLSDNVWWGTASGAFAGSALRPA